MTINKKNVDQWNRGECFVKFIIYLYTSCYVYNSMNTWLKLRLYKKNVNRFYVVSENKIFSKEVIH